jgi:hypothetical protein
MAETAAHLVDRVFPPLPVRQWVLSVPKRLRYFLEQERVAASVVLNIFLRVVEAHLRRSCPGASAQARFGALSCVHRCGASLNRHLHDHGGIQSPSATDAPRCPSPRWSSSTASPP